MWRLPVDDEYREMIKSGIADIVNSGGRWGGAVTAAMFLKEFVARHAVDPSRHRGRRLDGGQQAVDCEGAVGRGGAVAGGVCEGFRGQELMGIPADTSGGRGICPLRMMKRTPNGLRKNSAVRICRRQFFRNL